VVHDSFTTGTSARFIVCHSLNATPQHGMALFFSSLYYTHSLCMIWCRCFSKWSFFFHSRIKYENRIHWNVVAVVGFSPSSPSRHRHPNAFIIFKNIPAQDQFDCRSMPPCCCILWSVTDTLWLGSAVVKFASCLSLYHCLVVFFLILITVIWSHGFEKKCQQYSSGRQDKKIHHRWMY